MSNENDSAYKMLEKYTDNKELKKSILRFVQMRIDVNSPLTIYGLKIILKRLSDLTEDDEEKIKILEKSIACNWRYIYPLRRTLKYDKELEKEFENIWEIYPNKKGKQKALEYYIKARQEGETYERIKKGVEDYLLEIKVQGTQESFIKHGNTWFYNKCWLDEYYTVGWANSAYKDYSGDWD